MKMYAEFKNPNDGSEEDELDELVNGDIDVPEPEAVADNIDTESDVEADDIASGSDFTMSEDNDDDDDDDFSDEDDDDDDADNDKPKKTAKKIKNSNDNDGPGTSRGGAAGGNDEGAGGVFDMNEDEEEDETVRAIIAAIKKPRTSPPEIKVEDFITDISFHPERDIIGLATIIGDVHLYKYANEGNELIRTIEVHAKSCRDIEFTNDGSKLLSCSKDKCIMVTDMQTEKLVKFYETAHDVAINKLHVIDERLFATGDDTGVVKLWDLRTKDAIFELKEVEDQVTQILTNESKKFLLVTSGDGYLTTLNIGARKMFVQSEPYEEELNCMGIYRGDSKLVVGTSKGRLYTYNWGQFGYHCDMYPGIKTPISVMIPITDRIACVAGEEGVIRACHIAPYRNLGVVGQHNMPVESLDINCSGELIASSSHNNDVRFWNVKYFEDFGDIKYNEKHNTFKEKRHNLPSSKVTNTSDFFADMAKPADDDQ